MLVASAQQDPALDAPFSVAVHPNGNQVIVAPAGELDIATVGTLDRQLVELRAAGFADIVVDLRELTFIDSSGLNLLLSEHRAALARGERFRLIDGSPAVQRLFELTATTDHFDFVGRT